MTVGAVPQLSVPGAGATGFNPSNPYAPGAYKPGQAVGVAQQGYNQALASLQNSLNASNNTTSGQMMQAGQQLQQQQGQVAQNLTNRGLGNTTVAQTMQQAPLQTYNQNVNNIQNAGAERQMGAYDQLAGQQAQGGQQLANLMQPYAQTGVANGMAQQQQYQQLQMAAQQQAAQQNAAAFAQFNSQPAGGNSGTGF